MAGQDSAHASLDSDAGHRHPEHRRGLVLNGSEFDLILMLVFGIVGFLTRKTGFPMAPLILGLVLGGLIEVNFRRALTYSYGDYSTFYGSPITIGLWIITFLSLVAPVIIRFIKKRLAQQDDVD